MKKTFTKRTFPYAFARVSVMRTKLVKKEEYHKMLKMDLPSITRFLQESEFKDSITKLSGKYSGLELVDRALRRNQAKTFEKIRRICPDEIVEVIELYLSKADFQSLKVVLRGIYSNASKEEVMSLVEPLGKFDEKYYEHLFETGTVEKALQNSKNLSDKEIKSLISVYKEKSSLIKLENALDKIYYEHSIKGSEVLKEHGEDFRTFLLSDIDIVNIKNLLRFKNENLAAHEIMEQMIIQGKRLQKKQLISLSKKDNVESLYTALKKTYYGKYVKFEGKISEVELELNKFHVKNIKLHSRKNPLSAQNILSYMLSKIFEIRNIRSLVKSKHMGIDSAFIEKKLLLI